MEMAVSAEGEEEEGGAKVPLKIRGEEGEQIIRFKINCRAGMTTCDPVVVYAVVCVSESLTACFRQNRHRAVRTQPNKLTAFFTVLIYILQCCNT